MASSTLIQRLDNEAGLSNASTSNRRQVEVFIAKETVTVGAWVAFDYAATSASDITLGVYLADGNSTPVRTPMGVVVKSKEPSGTLTAGSRIEVCISGECSAQFVDTSGGAGTIRPVGTLLQITNTAGKCDLASAASAQPICGILCEASVALADTTYRTVVIKQF